MVCHETQQRAEKVAVDLEEGVGVEAVGEFVHRQRKVAVAADDVAAELPKMMERWRLAG